VGEIIAMYRSRFSEKLRRRGRKIRHAMAETRRKPRAKRRTIRTAKGAKRNRETVRCPQTAAPTATVPNLTMIGPRVSV